MEHSDASVAEALKAGNALAFDELHHTLSDVMRTVNNLAFK
jgi:hypothetical protein